MIQSKSSLMYLLLILISSVFAYIANDFIINDTLIFEHFGQQLSLEKIEQMLNFKDQWAWVNYGLLPFFYLIKFSLISMWILSGTIIFGYKNTFKEIFQVVLVAEFVWLIPSLITIIWFGFIDTSYSLLDVQYFQPLSLLNFFDAPSLDSWLIFPLKSLNLFEVIYLLVLTIGIKRIIQRDYRVSLNFTISVYGSALITWIIFITFLSINLDV